ncbi:adenosylcobalamin-dependent ribonucleoside-diphosphate reductase [Syntrophothermus lipocalidus]|uniref:Vitamin B12-dependent ribonucleotide reductase n=1 Tax=Syntrophothermus lipocalidus (strain DSM 12680 / TGB-C1) TaxID=643648 RepID=D7CPV3_SYNLT|nr:adenosylcobalamin-dependent ribonucleoside-diphosphate reductase [Syntrophothermus lipocalidus]ADI02731.1 ribonucleoside-diphosphate reductase, adenosylcobalamin-dependent [Syntrophothermus lipocalidus DSM 12680]
MLSADGQKLFEARYAIRDEKGTVAETFDQAVGRLARTVATAEKEPSQWEERFARIIGELFFVPSTPIWANVGKPDRPWQPAACFVLPLEDSLESVFETLKDTALVFKSGGGVGYNFSAIRPRGFPVRSSQGQAFGVVELLRLYDHAAGIIVQGGVRRGACMGILNADHPEILEFIRAKLAGGLANFNLSVGVGDAFMEAVRENGTWRLVFNGQAIAELPAAEVWEAIVEASHACGEPGLVFLDALQRSNPIRGTVIAATNPCGEVPLLAGESCILGSINLAPMVDAAGNLKEVQLAETVGIAVRFLDNLIDVGQYPLTFIAQTTRATRRIGVGFTGLADALIKSGLAYDSEEGRAWADRAAAIIKAAAEEASRELAREKGAFPWWGRSVYYPDDPRRNAALLSVAPTGSVTLIAACEGYGIEPIFAVAYTKSTSAAGKIEVFSPLFLQECERHGIPETVRSEVARRGSCQGVDGIPADMARVFKGAREIAPEDHLLMQAAVQKHVDNAVSKTVNLPREATPADVDHTFRLAWELGLKGVTVFREGAKPAPVTVGAGEPEEPPEAHRNCCWV